MLALGATQTPEMIAHGENSDANITANNRQRCRVCADPDGNVIVLLALMPAEQKFSIAALADPFIVSRMTTMRNAANSAQRKAN